MTWLLLLMLSNSAGAVSAPQLSDVTSSRSDEAFETRMSFSEPVPDGRVTLDFVNETIQINVLGAKTSRPRNQIFGSDPNVKSVYLYQSNPQTLRARLILKKGQRADSYRDRITVGVEDKDITLRLKDEYTIEQKLAEPPVAVGDSPRPSTVEKSESVLASEMGDLSKEMSPTLTSEEKIPETAIPSGQAIRDESQIPVLTADTKTKTATAGEVVWVRILGSLALCLLVLGVGAYGYQRWHRQKALPTSNATIKLITQFHLGPKKSMAVVRIAGETLLVGITDSSINLIKTLSILDDEISDEAPRYFRQALGNAETRQTPEDLDQISEPFSIKGLKDVAKSRFGFSKES